MPYVQKPLIMHFVYFSRRQMGENQMGAAEITRGKEHFAKHSTVRAHKANRWLTEISKLSAVAVIARKRESFVNTSWWRRRRTQLIVANRETKMLPSSWEIMRSGRMKDDAGILQMFERKQTNNRDGDTWTGGVTARFDHFYILQIFEKEETAPLVLKSREFGV